MTKKWRMKPIDLPRRFGMPAAEIKPYLMNVKISGLGRVKAYWKVSIKSLIKRTYDLKLATASQYKSMNIQYSKMFKEGEPINIEIEKPRKVAQMI